MKFYFTSILLFLSSFVLHSQVERTIKYCGQVEATEKLFHQHPDRHWEMNMANAWLEEYTSTYSANRGGDQTIYIIPVVFHVIHNNGTENITDEQIENGLEILTRDFRLQNSDVALVTDAFQSITADVGIEFRLASKDPDGNCTRGINRIESELTNEGGDLMKSLIYWPRDEYLNIWVCADAAGAAGYTQLPGNVSAPWAASGDGIVIRSDYVGAIGTSSNTRSRTLTHEVGHWLNLAHTWGPTNNPGIESNCNFDDNVADTPNTIGWTECVVSGASCGNTIDNVQNYMEYSYCSRMFTQGQADRMRAAITSPVAQRNQLITNSNLAATGVTNPPLCAIDFSVDRTSVCAGTPLQFTDLSYHGVTEWTWNFGDGTVLSGSDVSTLLNPTHTYNTPGVYDVTLTVTNPTGTLTVSQVDLITIVPLESALLPLAEGFEGTWPSDDWSGWNELNDATWEITPSTFFSGSKSLKLRNFNSTTFNSKDDLYSRVFDMSGVDTVYVSYKWAYANKTLETDDRLRISASPNCGTDWELVRIIRGLSTLPTAPPTNTSWTPSGLEQWTGETITITDSELLTDGFRLNFSFWGRGGNNFYLDDINIWTSASSGVGVTDNTGTSALRVYPVPSSGDITIEWTATGTETVDLNVYDVAGKWLSTVYSGAITSGVQRFVLPQQAAGVYFLRARTSSGQLLVRKVVFE
jgi:PKD repeat protein